MPYLYKGLLPANKLIHRQIKSFKTLAYGYGYAMYRTGNALGVTISSS